MNCGVEFSCKVKSKGTVHAGTYRESINPPRGGESNTRRIVYQAAPGEVVEIKGSEIIKGWTRNRKTRNHSEVGAFL